MDIWFGQIEVLCIWWIQLDMADENPASEHINSKDRSFIHNP